MASANAVLDNACSKRTRSRPDSRRRASRGRKAAGIRCPAGSSWAALAPAAADARKGTAGWAGARCWGLPGSLGGVASCDRWIKRCNARGNRPALAGQPTVVRLVREGCHDEAGPGALPIYSVICTCTGRAPSTVLAPATPQPWLPAPSCSWPWPSRSWPLPTLCARVMGRHTAVRTRGCAAIVLVGGARRAQARTRTAVASADRTAEPRRGACSRLPALNSAGEPNRGSRVSLVHRKAALPHQPDHKPTCAPHPAYLNSNLLHPSLPPSFLQVRMRRTRRDSTAASSASSVPSGRNTMERCLATSSTARRCEGSGQIRPGQPRRRGRRRATNASTRHA